MGTRTMLAGLLGLLLISGCRAEPTRARVIVLAVDGADPRAVDLLMSEGRLPHFTRLRRQGAYGRLQSSRPLLGPVVSTTMATGKPPDAHGIGSIVAVDRTTGETWPVTSGMRRVKALWNILSDANRTVAVVGWGTSWPAETVRGSMVSDRFAYDALLETRPGEPAPGTSTFPAALEHTVRPCVKRPQDLTLQEADAFLDITADEFRRPFDVEDDLSQFKWALATAGTSTCIALRLWNEQKPATLMVHIDAIDVASHLFGHLFRAGGLPEDPAQIGPPHRLAPGSQLRSRNELARATSRSRQSATPSSGAKADGRPTVELAQQQKRYGGAVQQLYVYADGVIGELMKAMDDGTSLLVISGHGFELNALPDDRSTTPGMRRAGEPHHREQGFLYLYGRDVRPRARLQNATILDIAPTVLALNRVAPAQDMPGRVLAEALRLAEPARRASYESEASRAGPASSLPGEGVVTKGARDTAIDRIALRRWQALGYLSQDARPGETGLPAQRSDHERRALVLAESARQAASRGLYANAMKQLDEAGRIAPRYPLIYQYRSNVAYLMGDREQAIAALEKGLELQPDNELFRQNLKRLQQEHERGRAKSRK